jgi:fumarate reductase subunit D
MKFRIEPFWWSLFGAGGTLSAFFLPILLICFGIAIPLGWLEIPSFEYIKGLVEPLLSRIVLIAIISLSLFHWAHRFRFTLYEGLQLHRFNLLIAVLCYGSATAVALFTVYSLLSF